MDKKKWSRCECGCMINLRLNTEKTCDICNRTITHKIKNIKSMLLSCVNTGNEHWNCDRCIETGCDYNDT